MNNNTKTPYDNLGPNLIINAIENLGFKCSGSLLALNSYENRVYQIGIEDSAPLIAKFYRPLRWTDAAILEEHQFELELAEHEIPVVAPWISHTKETLHQYHDFRFALFPRWGGRALEVDSLTQLEWMGRFIGRLHAVGASQQFAHRQKLDVQNHGYVPYRFLIDNDFIPLHLKENYSNAVETALQKVEKLFQQAGEISSIRLHGDIHAGNVLWNDAGPHIVDLDDCMMGPAIQDIWMLLSGNQQQSRVELECILNGYRDFYHFNIRELQLIEALRTLRQIHYSAWLARRWDDPAFPVSFPWFNTIRYWEEQLLDVHKQIELLVA